LTERCPPSASVSDADRPASLPDDTAVLIDQLRADGTVLTYAPSKAALLQLVFDETMAEVYGSLRQAKYATVR
jgi:hypothetical protein